MATERRGQDPGNRAETRAANPGNRERVQQAASPSIRWYVPAAAIISRAIALFSPLDEDRAIGQQGGLVARRLSAESVLMGIGQGSVPMGLGQERQPSAPRSLL